jgi:hypothetical protein
MIFTENEPYILLNNALKSNITNYKIQSEYVKINNQIKFIGNVYDNNDTFKLKIEYIILGSYDTSNNMWIWATKSHILNNTIINEIKQIREYCLLESKEYFSIMPYITFYSNILSIAMNVYKQQSYNLITFKRHKFIDIYIVKNILYECVL